MGEGYNWKEIVDELNSLLKLKVYPVGMKLYEKKEDMLAVPKIRIPEAGKKFYACQLIAWASRMNFTVGFTMENLAVAQCTGILGMCPREIFENAKNLTGIWFANDEETKKHQMALNSAPNKYEAVGVSPLASGRIPDPDVCLIYGVPAQIMFMINGYQYFNFERVGFSLIGESTCNDSWGKTLSTGKPGLSIPCYGERRFGGILDDEMLITFTPKGLMRALEGLRALNKNGIRYPILYHGIQNDVEDIFAKE